MIDQDGDRPEHLVGVENGEAVISGLGTRFYSRKRRKGAEVFHPMHQSTSANNDQFHFAR